MKNSIGRSVILTLFGESHGEAIGAVLDGFAPGIEVSRKLMDANLSKRRPNAKTDTARIEKDEYRILSGVFNGFTTGAPISVVIPNGNTDSSAYDDLRGKARPSHADYAAFCKYHGFEDYRGGGHFSGRITAPIVAIGAICLGALEKLGIRIGTHILRCGNAKDKPFSDFSHEIGVIEEKMMPVIGDVESDIEAEIIRAKENGDSIGGITQTAIIGLPSGLGEPWFSSVEGDLSNAMFSIGGIKGIEFGLGFGLAGLTGSKANDPFRMNNGKVETITNNNGGVNGGITNGMPVVFQCAVKPTPSISKLQQTVDFAKCEDVSIGIKGRHDPAIIRRICIVITSLTAVVVCDLIASRFGTDALREGKWE